jgi:DNA repair ATPase RecN
MTQKEILQKLVEFKKKGQLKYGPDTSKPSSVYYSIDNYSINCFKEFEEVDQNTYDNAEQMLKDLEEREKSIKESIDRLPNNIESANIDPKIEAIISIKDTIKRGKQVKKLCKTIRKNLKKSTSQYDHDFIEFMLCLLSDAYIKEGFDKENNC